MLFGFLSVKFRIRLIEVHIRKVLFCNCRRKNMLKSTEAVKNRSNLLELFLILCRGILFCWRHKNHRMRVVDRFCWPVWYYRSVILRLICVASICVVPDWPSRFFPFDELFSIKLFNSLIAVSFEIIRRSTHSVQVNEPLRKYLRI